MSNCPDVGAMLVELEQFHPMFAQDRVRLQRHTTATDVLLTAEAGGPATPDTVDAFFALVSRSATGLAGPTAAPTVVSLRRRRPDDPPAYDEMFSRIRFAQPVDRCVFTRQALAAPLIHADPVVLNMLQPYARRLIREPAADWTGRVRTQMEEGRVSLPDVARTLLVSPRTLQKKLAAESSSFASLADRSRCDRAFLLLADTTLPITVVADRLGFATGYAFTRAVRRWTGLTPSGYRRRGSAT